MSETKNGCRNRKYLYIWNYSMTESIEIPTTFSTILVWWKYRQAIATTTDNRTWQDWRPKRLYCRFWLSVVVAVVCGLRLQIDEYQTGVAQFWHTIRDWLKVVLVRRKRSALTPLFFVAAVCHSVHFSAWLICEKAFHHWNKWRYHSAFSNCSEQLILAWRFASVSSLVGVSLNTSNEDCGKRTATHRLVVRPYQPSTNNRLVSVFLRVRSRVAAVPAPAALSGPDRHTDEEIEN